MVGVISSGFTKRFLLTGSKTCCRDDVLAATLRGSSKYGQNKTLVMIKQIKTKVQSRKLADFAGLITLRYIVFELVRVHTKSACFSGKTLK